MRKQLMKLKLNIMSFVHGGCHQELPLKESIIGLSEWLGTGTFVLGNGMVT
jgi:hypothetical protein